MTTDPVYLANVSSAMIDAMREAQDLVEEGELGAPLVEVIRHARELHDILVEELSFESRPMPEYAGGALMEMGDRLRTLEQYLNAH